MSVTNYSFFRTFPHPDNHNIRTFLCSFDSSFYNLNLFTLTSDSSSYWNGIVYNTHRCLNVIFFNWLSSLTLFVLLNNFLRRHWWSRSASLWQFPPKSSRELLPVSLSCYMVSDGKNNVMKIWPQKKHQEWLDWYTYINLHVQCISIKHRKAAFRLCMFLHLGYLTSHCLN